jgi:hypothetical protein
VSDRLTVGFADASGTIAGVALDAASGLLLSDGSVAATPVVAVEERDGGWRALAEGKFEVELRPLGAPAVYSGGRREWPCRVRGTAAGQTIDGLGQCALEAKAPDWDALAMVRGISIWLAEDLCFACRAERAARAQSHEQETLEAFIWRGQPLEPAPIFDARLSTTYDGDGRQRRAGLELWEGEESDFALRIGGEARDVGELVLPDGARLRSAFYVWRHDGREGGGRYDLVTVA